MVPMIRHAEEAAPLDASVWWTDTQNLLAMRTFSDDRANRGYNYDLSDLAEVVCPDSRHPVRLAIPLPHERFWVLFAVTLVNDGVCPFTLVLPASVLMTFSELSS